MWAAIGDIAYQVLTVISKVWNGIKALLRLDKAASWMRQLRKRFKNINRVVCGVKWYFYLRQLELAYKWLRSFGVSPSEAAVWLGLNRLMGQQTPDEKAIMRALSENTAGVQDNIDFIEELERRRKLAPSVYEGVHISNRSSIPGRTNSLAILEIWVSFDQIKGYGTMILFYNPEGFGNKPKEPQIIRFCPEREIADFINAPSWGRHWRFNYVDRALDQKGNATKRTRQKRFSTYEEIDKNARGTSRKAQRVSNYLDGKRLAKIPYGTQHEQFEEENLISGQVTRKSRYERLSDSVQRILDGGSIDEEQFISETEHRLVDEAMTKYMGQIESITRGLEANMASRSMEAAGFRVNSKLEDLKQRIPGKLQQIINNNPLFKDLAKITSVYKKTWGRYRYLRDRWIASNLAKDFSAKQLALYSSLGSGRKIAMLNAQVLQFAADGTAWATVTETIRASEVTDATFAELAGEFTSKADAFNLLAEQHSAKIAEFKAIDDEWMERLQNGGNLSAEGPRLPDYWDQEAFDNLPEWNFDNEASFDPIWGDDLSIYDNTEAQFARWREKWQSELDKMGLEVDLAAFEQKMSQSALFQPSRYLKDIMTPPNCKP